jgi:hypothetical protein
MKIYVDLLDEGTAVWCPVKALHLHDDVYQIVEVNSDPEDTRWAFESSMQTNAHKRPEGNDLSGFRRGVRNAAPEIN